MSKPCLHEAAVESVGKWNKDPTSCINEFQDSAIVKENLEVFNANDPRLAETVELASQLLPCQEMTPWQRAWCTTANVARYLRGRNGDPHEAARILAQALLWRQDFEAVLSGSRVPRWQGDLRVVARGHSGHTIVYGSFRHMPVDKSSPDAIDHMVAVLEAWHLGLRHSATQGDVILDCHGFRLSHTLQPALLAAGLRAIQQPFRDCLRSMVVVEAPRSFQVLWRLVAPLMRPATARKIQFLSCKAAVQWAHSHHGAVAAGTVESIIRLNRIAEGSVPTKFPSEIEGESDSDIPCRVA